MDKFEIMREIEALGEDDRAEVVRWAASKMPGPHPGSGLKSKIALALSSGPRRLRDITMECYGSNDRVSTQMTYKSLTKMVESGEARRVSRGVYELGGQE